MSFCRSVCRKTLRCCLRVPGCKLVCYKCLLPMCFGDDESDTEEKDDEGYFSCAAPLQSETHPSTLEGNISAKDSVEYYNQIEIHQSQEEQPLRLLSDTSEQDIPDTSAEGDTTFFSANGEQYYANIDSTPSDHTVIYHNIGLPTTSPPSDAHEMGCQVIDLSTISYIDVDEIKDTA